MKMFRSSITVQLQLIVLAMLASIANLPEVNSLSGDSTSYTPTLTYFFGAKPPADRICYEKVIPKGTVTPVLVQYTAATNIDFVTVNADKNSKYGFRLSIVNGNTGTTTVGFRLTGKSVLPYSVIFTYWCT